MMHNGWCMVVHGASGDVCIPYCMDGWIDGCCSGSWTGG